MRRLLAAALLLMASAMPGLCASYDDLNAGIQLRNTGQWQSAVQAFDRALAAGDLAPGLRYVALLDRGEAHSSLGETAAALADYTASLALRPGDPAALVQRSAAYAAMRKFDEAATDLDSTLATHPFNTTILLRRAAVNARRGQFDKAVSDLDAAEALLPEGSLPYRSIGIIDWEANQAAKAEAHFSRAVDKNDHDIYAWLWLSLTEAKLGKDVPKRSLPDFDHKVWPAPIVALFLGEGSQEAVSEAAAKADAPEISGQTCEANFYGGEWLLQHHDPAAARPLIEKAAHECPANFVERGPAEAELANLQQAGSRP